MNRNPGTRQNPVEPQGNRTHRRTGDRQVTVGDFAVIFLGGCLALTSAMFAIYMLYQGPLRPGDDGFDLIRLTRAPGTEEEADPIVTGSTTQESPITRVEDIPSWFGVSGRAIGYRLKAVVEKEALVEISSGRDSFTWAAQRGGLVPGIGKVSDISLERGQWVISVQNIRISDRGTELSAQQ